MSIEIEEIIAKLNDVYRSIYRTEPGKPNLYEDRTEFLRVGEQLRSAIDGLCNPTEPRERRFTLTFSLEGEEFQAKGDRINIERVLKLLGQVSGCFATSTNTVPLFKDKDGNLFGEMRISWPKNQPKNATKP